MQLAADKTFETALPATHSAFIYSYEGDVSVDTDSEQRILGAQSAGVLSAGDRLRVTAKSESAQFIVVAGMPLNEPIVQRGPFVMNTREEIEQAIYDYQNGTLVAA